MGNSTSSVFDSGDGTPGITIPDGYITPSFPSLYIPTLFKTQSSSGIYLYEAEAIWRFTVYWTLLILCVIFLLCSLLAALTILLSLTIHRSPTLSHPSTTLPTPYPTRPPSPSRETKRKVRAKRKRPPLWPVILIPAVFTAVAAIVAVITGTVVGFAIAAVYSAGGFSVSTWVPFLWALIQIIVLIISSYSTLTSIL